MARRFALATGEEVPQGGANGIVLRLTAAHRARLVAGPHTGVGALDELEVVQSVAARHGGERVVRGESLQRVPPQGLE
jgi:hypothetical protein